MQKPPRMSLLTGLSQPSCVRGSILCAQRSPQQQVGGHVAAAHWGPHVHGVSKEGCELYLAVVPTDTQSGQGTRAGGNKSALGG